MNPVWLMTFHFLMTWGFICWICWWHEVRRTPVSNPVLRTPPVPFPYLRAQRCDRGKVRLRDGGNGVPKILLPERQDCRQLSGWWVAGCCHKWQWKMDEVDGLPNRIVWIKMNILIATCDNSWIPISSCWHALGPCHFCLCFEPFTRPLQRRSKLGL